MSRMMVPQTTLIWATEVIMLYTISFKDLQIAIAQLYRKVNDNLVLGMFFMNAQPADQPQYDQLQQQRGGVAKLQ